MTTHKYLFNALKMILIYRTKIELNTWNVWMLPVAEYKVIILWLEKNKEMGKIEMDK